MEGGRSHRGQDRASAGSSRSNGAVGGSGCCSTNRQGRDAFAGVLDRKVGAGQARLVAAVDDDTQVADVRDI